jgi:hypothetical protein
VTGAFWSWVAAQVHNAPYLCLFSWLPLALTWLLFHKATSLNAKFVGFNEYLMKVEDAFIRDGGAWEHFLKTGNLGLIPNVYSGVFFIGGKLFLFIVAIIYWAVRSGCSACFRYNGT